MSTLTLIRSDGIWYNQILYLVLLH
jgi:hypothetical protein